MGGWNRYFPAGIMAAGTIVTIVTGTPHPTALVQPLDSALPTTFLGAPGKTMPISADEARASGVTSYVNQGYDVGNHWSPVALYVGYHGTQQGDKGMHTPAVCLPGSGWTPVDSRLITIPVGTATFLVNRYVLQKESQRILVYYWFQGRGRVTAGQTELKLITLRDAFLYHRDEEALVRIVVPVENENLAQPVGTTGLPPDSIATRLTAQMLPAMQRVLPPAP